MEVTDVAPSRLDAPRADTRPANTRPADPRAARFASALDAARTRTESAAPGDPSPAELMKMLMIIMILDLPLPRWMVGALQRAGLEGVARSALDHENSRRIRRRQPPLHVENTLEQTRESALSVTRSTVLATTSADTGAGPATATMPSAASAASAA